MFSDQDTPDCIGVWFRTSQYSLQKQAFRYQNAKEYFSWEGRNQEAVLNNAVHILMLRLTYLKQQDKILGLISSKGIFCQKIQQFKPKNVTVVYFWKACLENVWSPIAHKGITFSLQPCLNENRSGRAGSIPGCLLVRQTSLELCWEFCSSCYYWFYYWRVWLSFGVEAQSLGFKFKNVSRAFSNSSGRHWMEPYSLRIPAPAVSNVAAWIREEKLP